MSTYPRILKIETGYLEKTFQYFPTDEFIDYHVYEQVPQWWRWIEQLLRLDIYLAYKARQIAHRYDIVWANSEKVAVPLSFLKIRQPLVVILHDPESPLRMFLIRLTGIVRKWAGIGIVSHNARMILESKFRVDPERIFQYFAAPTDSFHPAGHQQPSTNGPILSIGVAKRDYRTMIAALSELPGYTTEIFVSSKYGDLYNGPDSQKVPGWIRFPDRMSDEELRCKYQEARFVVVPLIQTSHAGAGITSICEASASGKAVIATDTSGITTYIVPGVTGLLVPPGDVMALRNAIRKLWENPGLAFEMGQAGRKFMEEHFAQEKIVAATTAFLKKLWLSSNHVDPQDPER